MSHTTARPRRFGRLAAGLTVAAAATATTLLGATPAYAQTTAVIGSVSGGTLFISGTASADNIETTGGTNGSVTFANFLGTAAPGGPGCFQVGTKVQCIGVSRISIDALGGNDTIRNFTQLASSVFGRAGDDFVLGGSGNDTIDGGSGNDDLRGEAGNDRLTGGLGTDRANGRDGTDTCTAESEASCEL